MEISLSKRQMKMVDILLKESEYCTAATLANLLKVSEKTIHGEIAEINRKSKACMISSLKGKGYIVRDKDVWIRQNYIVGDEGRRDIKILKEILFNEHVDYYELADRFYISPSTLNKDIRILNERIQKEFRTLRITRKQNHLFLNCDDIEKRRVLTYFLLEESEDQRFDVGILDRYFENVDVYGLSEILMEFIHRQQLAVSDFNLFSILLHMLMYISNTSYICMEEERASICDQDCRPLLEAIRERMRIQFTAEGTQQICALFKKRNAGQDDVRIMQFLHEVLREIYDIYSINFTENQDLMDNLALHLQNLRNRCKHGMLIKNPLLSELKQSFVLIYDIAAYIAIRFQEQTGYVLDENEIRFIALHIMNGIKSIKTSIVRIALINPYGNSVTHIIQQRFQALTDVEMIGCFSMFDFKTLYTEKPDIIVTMVSTSEQMGVPVFQLDNYLQDEEYEKIERIVKSVRVKKSYENIMIHNYFMEDLFCIPSQLTTKDEVITYLCSLLEEQGYVDADFQEQIYEREAIAPTCFGARYAIPHTTKKTAKKNGIAVALLRKPVIWDGFEVNIVLMFALHKSFDQVPKLYDLILNVFDDPIRFAQVLECDSYTAFMKKIHIT